jgi:hypothetical protein
LPPILDEGELHPGVPKLVYLGYDEDDLAHEALLTDPGRGVIVKALWRQSYKPENRPAENAERLQAFNDVVNAFSFLPTDYVAGDPNAYYIQEGVVRIPYTASNEEHEERFEIGFDGKTQRMKIGFEYEYREPRGDEHPGLLARVATTMAEWAFEGRSLRSRHRVVGGFSGEESVIHATEDHRLTFAWMYEPAASALGFQPTITISGESDDGDITAVLSLRDQVLDPIQRLAP